MDFIHDANPSRVIFAAGARSKTGAELDRLGASRLMIVATPTQAGIAAEFARLIGDRAGIVYPGAQPHTPTNVTEAALTAVSSVKADGVLAIGGGTAIGLSKAIALRTESAATDRPDDFRRLRNDAGPAGDGTRRQDRCGAMRASCRKTVIFDPELVSALPRIGGGTLGDECDRQCCRGAVRAERRSADGADGRRSDPRARRRAAAHCSPMRRTARLERRALWLMAGGRRRRLDGTALHHKICDVLVGAFDLNHADVHCAMLPYTAAFHRRQAPDAMRRVARALGGEDAPALLYDLASRVANQNSLKAMGLTRAALEKAADLVVRGQG